MLNNILANKISVSSYDLSSLQTAGLCSLDLYIGKTIQCDNASGITSPVMQGRNIQIFVFFFEVNCFELAMLHVILVQYFSF